MSYVRVESPQICLDGKDGHLCRGGEVSPWEVEEHELPSYGKAWVFREWKGDPSLKIMVRKKAVSTLWLRIQSRG